MATGIAREKLLTTSGRMCPMPPMVVIKPQAKPPRPRMAPAADDAVIRERFGKAHADVGAKGMPLYLPREHPGTVGGKRSGEHGGERGHRAIHQPR